MSATKIVTYVDLGLLQAMRQSATYRGATTDLLDRLIAAAETVDPPLPEGWVLLYDPGYGDGPRVVWHRANCLFIRRDDVLHWGTVAEHRNNLTPLRPKVTEADIERGAIAAHEAEYIAKWAALHETTQAGIRNMIRAALAAAGIEVES